MHLFGVDRRKNIIAKFTGCMMGMEMAQKQAIARRKAQSDLLLKHRRQAEKEWQEKAIESEQT